MLIVYFWLPLRGSLTFICPVYCVPYVVRFSSVYFCCSWFPNVYLSCVLCTLCCQVQWIAPSWSPNVYLSTMSSSSCYLLQPNFFVLRCQVPRLRKTNLSLYCVPYVVRFSVYFWLPLRGSIITFIYPVYCVPYVVRFSAPSWFPNVYLSCVLCTLCCQVLCSCPFVVP